MLNLTIMNAQEMDYKPIADTGKAQSALAVQFKTKGLQIAAEEISQAFAKIDQSSLQIAYAVQRAKQALEHNSDGIENDFVAFCSKYFGIQKAQAYNHLATARFVICYDIMSTRTVIDEKEIDENGKPIERKEEFVKERVYTDCFTNQLIHEQAKAKYPEYETSDEQYCLYWDFVKAQAKKRKCFGATALLTINRALNKRAIEVSDVMHLMEIHAISVNSTIKQLNEQLATFNLETSNTGNTGNRKPETVSIPKIDLEKIVPEIEKAAKKNPKFAAFYDLLIRLEVVKAK